MMFTRRRVKAFLLSLLVFALVFTVGAAPTNPRDRLQGQVSLEDQESGRSLRPYTDNMKLVGQNDINNRGMNGNLGWLDDCAYVSAYFGADHPLAGLATVDVSNPKKPELVEIQPGTPGTRESQVEANEARRLVIVMPFRASTIFGDPPGPNELQIYQASDDCRELTRVGTYDFGNAVVTHEHRISADGNTVYATINSAGVQADALQVVDISDLSDPTLLTTYDITHEPGREDNTQTTIHDLDVNADGSRAYLAYRYRLNDGVRREGLAIVDTTQVAGRRPDPEIRLISEFNWRPPENIGLSHSAQLANINGRRYVIMMDETFTTSSCPWGWARIIDVTDEENPLQISTMRLEVSQRRNCETTLRDNAMYSSHYIGVDDVDDTSMVFMTWYSSGLRVFDIRDPYNPKEIGSYIPGAKTDTEFVDTSDSRFANNRVPYTYSFVRYRPDTGHIWFTDIYNGFIVAELVRGLEQQDRSAR